MDKNNMPTDATKGRKPITYLPVPFNFIDLEAKATDYLTKVKTEAVQVTAQARNEVARLRETTLGEIERIRSSAQQESETIRKQLETLRIGLQNEEERFRLRKEELEREAISLKEQLRLNEDAARKNGYEEGRQLGYEEGRSQGYADGELQATIDYGEKVRNEAVVQLGAQLETLFPALKSMVSQLDTAKQSFLQLWEQSAIKIAAEIAGQAIARELPQMIDVPLKLLREALELGAGSTSVKIRLHPDDYESLQPQVDLLVNEMKGAAHTEIVSDPKMSHGGCVLETSLGVIDNRIESRLQRIEEELVMKD